MASTSASSVQKSFKYDVFLSFRGEDTRKGFVDHLYHALNKRGLITYKDDERIEKGERINEQLIRSIEESRFYIIVFSKNYASSSWCLDELVKIMECQKMAEHTAYPVFYDVEPTEVRHQSGVVGEAFAKVVGKGKTTEEDVDVEEKDAAGKWKDALKEAAGLAGWELKNTLDGHEAKFIEKIMEEILPKLYFINSSIDDDLVGMEVRVNKIISSLEIGLDSVRMIGIKGMGGGGKTTLATAVFDHISGWFEGVSFVENVREVSKRSLYGLKELQKKVLSDVLNDKDAVVKSVSEGKNKIKRMMGSRKVLIVLDDVDDTTQLEALAGKPTWFKQGSRIIITTRDEQVLTAHRVSFIHDVNLLTHQEAICLFSRHAFDTEVPAQGYEELSGKVIDYAAGLPLTLKVLGSHLCGRPHRIWEDAIERLKTIPLEKTLTRLEISYDGLENDQKEIFLDVACILKGEKRETAIRTLESRGFHAEIGLKVLEQKSLLTVSNYGFLEMHDHLEEMGKNIVRRSHPEEPSKHNRLWITEEIEEILAKDQGTNGTTSIKLIHPELRMDIIMTGLRKMEELRVLFVVSYDDDIPNPVDQYLPNTLQSLCWRGYPFACLPKTFQANNLVHLEMYKGNLAQLWEGGERKVLNKLKFLVLIDSDIRSFDMGMTPNLQTFSLIRCMQIVELSKPVACPKLKLFNLTDSKVSSLNIVSAPCLEKLEIQNCNCLVELHIPVEWPKLKLLYLRGSKVSSLNIVSAPCLQWLHLLNCNDLVELHIPVECPKLKVLDLHGSKVSSLNIVSAPCLQWLHLQNCNDLVELHIPVECPNLKHLNLSGSTVSSLNIVSAPCLERLYLQNCNDLVELHIPVEWPKLELLDLSGSKVSSLNIVSAPCLDRLYLQNCNDLVELHIPAECPKLEFLDLSGSKVSSLNIVSAPCLERLYLKFCNDLVELHLPVECPKLKFLDLSGSKVSSLNIVSAPCLKSLDLENCNDLVELHIPVECPKLKILNLSGSTVSSLNIVSAPCLKWLDLQNCNDLVEELHIPVECPKLERLDLHGSKVSSLNIVSAPCLKWLDLQNCNDLVELHIPVECPKLERLDLHGSKVSSLNIVSAPCLKSLDLENCNYLVELHIPVEWPKLELLDLRGSKVSSLNIVSAPCLQLLYLENCNDLVELHIPVECPKLELLDLHGSKVSSLNIVSAPCLECLYLQNCNDLVELHIPVECPKLELLDLSGSKVSGILEKLLSFGLCACTNLESFSASICGLQRLIELTLEGSIPEVPKDLHLLQSLEHLTLSMKEITHLPDSICMLKHLKSLKLRYCQLLEQLPNDLGRLEALEELHLTDCMSLRGIPKSICNMKSLKYLDLHFCILVEKLPEEFGRLESLEEINIEGAGIKNLPQSIFELKGLYIVGSTWRLESYGFTSLKEISTYTASCYIRDSQHESHL